MLCAIPIPAVAARSAHPHCRAVVAYAVAALIVVLISPLTRPSFGLANQNQYGAQSRADAASEMIVLGVEQGISSLPPPAGQSFSYEYDPKTDTYTMSTRLGPTVFRTPATVGAGNWSVRLATSYFELDGAEEPIPYLVDAPGLPLGVAALGLSTSAKVGLLNLSVNYGISYRLELTMNLPVVVVDAHATQSFTTRQTSGPPGDAPLNGVVLKYDHGQPDYPATIEDLNNAIGSRVMHVREASFSALGFAFNEGTHAGVGRISVGGKYILYDHKMVQVAAAPTVYLPSPSEAEFAGPDSAAIFPRLVAAFACGDAVQFPFSDAIKLYADVGYNYDFDHDELRSFVWNVGPSLALTWATFDAGVGGSKYNEGIEWTPNTASFSDSAGNTGTIQALASNRLGSNYINALVGMKTRITATSVIAGAVSVPINDEGFRPAAMGTLAFEVFF